MVFILYGCHIYSIRFLYQNAMADTTSFFCTTKFIDVAIITIWRGQGIVVTTITFLSVNKTEKINLKMVNSRSILY